MKKIFISHNSKDKDKIDELVICLRLLNCEVFYSSESSTNSIEFGEDFYEKIKKEILNSDIVIFMVSNNFYESIPSLIEVGIAYGVGKRMIPVGFESGNYEKVLKGVFNTNKRLSCLDSENDILQLLHDISGSNDIIAINKFAKKIFNTTIKENKHSIESKNKVEDEIAATFTVDTKLSELDIVNKIKNLRSTDYIFIKYIVETRSYDFSFENDYTYWENRFSKWLKQMNLDREVNYSGFLNYLNKLGLLINTRSYIEIKLETIEALESIYYRDIEKINKAMIEHIDVM